MRFCSHEFFSREICSWARRLEISRYGLQGGVCPDAGSVESKTRDSYFCTESAALSLLKVVFCYAYVV